MYSIQARPPPPSAALPFLGNNDLPTPAARHSIQAHVEMLSNQLDDLFKHVRSLEEERTKYRAVLSAVRRLPTEILGEIFSLLFPRVLADEDRAYLVDLGLVCHRWREAVLHMRSLWSRIGLKACPCFRHGRNEVDVMHSDEYDNIVKWYAKAGGCSKTLTYHGSLGRCRCYESARCEATHPTLVRLLKEGPTLDHFTLEVTGTACLQSWLSAMDVTPTEPASPTPWSTLRSLALLFVDSYFHIWGNEEDPNLSLFARLPRVTEFRLDLPIRRIAFEDDEDPFIRYLNIPSDFLHRLTALSIRWDWGVRVLDILAQCINLESFTIDQMSNSLVIHSDDDPHVAFWTKTTLTLPSLRNFCVRRGGVDMLEYLTLPLLVSLDIELAVGEGESEDVSKDLSLFLTRCNLASCLKRLRICGLTGTDGVASLILPSLVGLEDLELDSSKVWAYKFDVDGDETNEMHAFPSLQHIKLFNLGRNEGTLSSEISYILERLGHAHCKITVSYKPDPPCSEEHLRELVPSYGLKYLTITVISPA